MKSAFGCMALVLALTTLVASQQAAGRSWYVAPNTPPGGSGTIDAPLDLVTALSAQGPVRPGDTVWLRGGVYRGSFDSHLTGTRSAPIVVRQMPGERAVIDSNDGTRDAPDGAFNIKVGSGYTWYWGFEVTNSHPKRDSADATAFPTDLYRANGVNVYASNVKLINLIVHDLENGVFVGDTERDVEIYGLLSYYNGHDAPTMAWGHGLYVQNALISDPRLVRDNITASNFSHGVHIYGGTDRGLNSIRLEGNISFQNGVISRHRLVRNLLLGGLTAAQNAVVSNNYSYYSRPDGENNIGWTAGAPGAVVTGNRFVGGRSSLVWGGPSAPRTVAENVFYGLVTPAAFSTSYPSNTYYGNRRPSELEYFVRPNQYEPGRAHIVVYNWPLQSSVTVDVAAASLRRGAYFELRDAQNYFGPPVLSGTFDGKPLVIPMTSRPVASPVGNISAAQPISTLPEFGAFVLTPVPARVR
jgi:hypothetical protein